MNRSSNVAICSLSSVKNVLSWHTHGAVGNHLCCGARGAVVQGSQLSRGIEGGESAEHSLPPPTNPRLESATFGLQVRLSIH